MMTAIMSSVDVLSLNLGEKVHVLRHARESQVAASGGRVRALFRKVSLLATRSPHTEGHSTC